MLSVSSRTRRPGHRPAIRGVPLATWRSAAACGAADLDLFFVPDGVSGPERRRRENGAKKICSGCEVRTECLRYALDTGERFGVWGGMTEAERSALRTA